jgi:ATP-dependent protease HslVU (ClpYQ) peptidase subunit
MSVIAWDGKTLAADKRASMGTLIRTTTKIFKLGDINALAAYTGDADSGEEVLAWFRDGADPAKFPPMQREKDTWAPLMVVWHHGFIWKYERTPHPLKLPPQHFAMGSGRDFALAAMHLGKTAAEAVEVACVFDSACGNGIDTLVHE